MNKQHLDNVISSPQESYFSTMARMAWFCFLFLSHNTELEVQLLEKPGYSQKSYIISKVKIQFCN